MEDYEAPEFEQLEFVKTPCWTCGIPATRWLDDSINMVVCDNVACAVACRSDVKDLVGKGGEHE
jgi:hypothetical protein